MRIIISPAKKMRVDTDSFDCRELPVFTAGCSVSAIYEFDGITTWTGDVVTD